MEFYDICPTISSGQKRKEIGLRKKKKRTKPEVMIISPINQGILLLMFFHLKKETGTKKGNSEPTKILKVKSCYCAVSEFSWRMK